MKKFIEKRTAALAVVLIAITQAAPAFADGTPAQPQASIITPGLGTLGAIVDWLWLMFI